MDRVLKRHVLRGLAVVLLLAPALLAQVQQPNTPHLAYLYPAGGQQGTTFRVQVGGRFLDGVAGALINARGVEARVVEHDKPLSPAQIADLREKAQAMQKKATDPSARKELLDLRLRIGDSLRRLANPVLSEIVTLEVRVAADAEPGTCLLRLRTPLGLSNPVAFAVGQLPEVVESDTGTASSDDPLLITLPATVNGRIVPGDVNRLQAPVRQPGQYLPGDVDRYRFHARKGQDLVVAASARALMPYLADAVPGWFQATLALFDAAGREVAYDDDFGFEPDPVLHYLVPADGEYVLEIKDALFRGREDFVYRIAIGELPFITSIFPLGGPAGAKTVVELTGWNLPAARLEVDGKAAARTGSVSAGRGGLVSNRRPFETGTLPEVVEREPNDSQKQAQPLTLPVVVNGRIRQAGDVDLFSFSGRAGDKVVAEITARRLGSPLDSTLELTDGSGRRIAFNDDHDDKAAALVTHQADSWLTAALPESGTYLLHVGDAQRKGGLEYGYRLRLSPPRPDFDLRITPSAVNVPAGGTVPITVYAVRRDTFSGDIALDLKDAPDGFTLGGGRLPAGQDQVRLTITAPPRVITEPLQLILEGRGTIGGTTITRRAMAAEEMMQAFAYRHLVPAGDLEVSVVPRGATRVSSRILTSQPVRIPAGGGAAVRVAIPPAYRTFANLQFDLAEPPDGVTLHDLALGAAGAEFVLKAEAAKATPGTRGNLIVTVTGERVPPANAKQPPPSGAARRRVQLGTLPAIEYEITK